MISFAPSAPLTVADPYPYAIEEGFDAYRTLMETRGKCIGIESRNLGIVLTGDSA